MYIMNSKKNVYSYCKKFLPLAVLVVTYPAIMFAAFDDPLSAGTLWDFLVAILNAVIYILFPIIVLMIVYTGFLFVSAQGNPTKLQDARRALIWTVVGALVILGSKALALAIRGTIEGFQ